jgi:Cu+-exporting ATPase
MREREEGTEVQRAVFAVRDIDCTTCAIGIEKRLKKVDGVERVRSAIMLDKIFVDYDESKVSVSAIVRAITEAGYSSYLTRRTGDPRRTGSAITD